MDTLNAENTQDEMVLENFADLFEQSIREEKRENTVVKGSVVLITHSDVIVDVGLKSEGRIATKEFLDANGNLEVKVGDVIDIFIERLEDRNGNTILSREKALKEEAWYRFEELHLKNSVIEGKIMGRVKGGCAVDLGLGLGGDAIGKGIGIVAFLPGSQVDIRPIKDLTPLIGLVQPFKILKMDRRQGNVVVSRRAILEEARAGAREALLDNIAENMILEGVVKNITDYGAFIDLGAIDGLLHITDMAWHKISHPSEILSIGQPIKVMVTKYNEETKRVSLGLKQLEKNTWDGFADKYSSGVRVAGVVTTVTDYGAFVELEPGVEGLVYHTEISWNAKNIHPRKLLKSGDKVEVMVLELDITKHKISLSIKQCKESPWSTFCQRHPIGSRIDGVVQNVADFGVFITIDEHHPDYMVEALIPAMELSWDDKPENELKKYKKGDAMSGVVFAVDIERERITISVKQLTKDKLSEVLAPFHKGEVITCTVINVKKEGIEVEVIEGVKTFIKKSELSKHKSEQRPERYGVGDKIDAKIVALEPSERKISLSIKALEVEEEKRVIDQYGSKDSGASLGEILGMALNKDKSE